MRKVTFAALILLLGPSLVDCGGGSTGPLQSLAINNQVAGNVAQFTATATYSNGRHVTPASVSWYTVPITFSFFGGNPHYRLTSSPYVPDCISAGAAVIVAVAPADPHAAATGTIPPNVMADFVQATTHEDDFVAATAPLNCP